MSMGGEYILIILRRGRLLRNVCTGGVAQSTGGLWRVRHQLVGDTGLYFSHLSRQEQCGVQEEVDCPLWEKSGNDVVASPTGVVFVRMG